MPTAAQTYAADMGLYANVNSTGAFADVTLLDALKSDTVDLVAPVRAIRAAVAGNIAIITARGNTRVIAILAGETRHVVATRILATGTTATGLEGMV